MKTRVLIIPLMMTLLTVSSGGVVHAQGPGIGLRLIRPAAGEVLTPGQEYLVEWSDTADHPGFYDLEYSIGGEETWIRIDSGIRRKSYLWKVPLILNDECRMRVVGYADTAIYLSTTTKSNVGVHSVEYDPFGNRLAISSGTTELRIWDAHTGSLHFEPKTGGYVPIARFSKDGKLLATLDSDSTIVVYDVEKRLVHTRIVKPDTRFERLAFLDGNDTLIVSDEEGMSLYEAHSGELIGNYPGIQILDIASTQRRVLVQEIDSRGLAVLDLWNGDRVNLDYADSTSNVLTARISHNGEYAAFSARNGIVEVWSVETGELHVHNDAGSIVHGVEFSPNDSLVFGLTGHQGMVRIWDVYTGEIVSQVTIPPLTKLHRAHFGPQGNRLITCNGDQEYGSARVWDVFSGELISEYLHSSRVHDALINPDNSGILTIDIWRAYIRPFDISEVFRDSTKGVFRIGYTVGVNERRHEAHDLIRVSPNPTSDVMEITLARSTSSQAVKAVRVFRSDGGEVLPREVVLFSGRGRITLDVSSLTSGLYWVKVELESGDVRAIPFIKG